jgi:hypothetical protein
MAQLTIEIPDELAQRLAPYKNQISEIFTNLVNTSLREKVIDKLDISSTPSPTELPTYLEIIDFLVNRPTSEQIATFKISEQSQTRLRELLQKNRDISLISSEVAELNLYEQLDTLMTIMKVRAYATMQSANTSNSTLK